MRNYQSELLELLNMLKAPLSHAIVAVNAKSENGTPKPILDENNKVIGFSQVSSDKFCFMPELDKENNVVSYTLCIEETLCGEYSCEEFTLRDMINYISYPSKRFCEFFKLSDEVDGVLNLTRFRNAASKAVELFFNERDHGYEIDAKNAADFTLAMCNIIQPMYYKFKKTEHKGVYTPTFMKLVANHWRFANDAFCAQYEGIDEIIDEEKREENGGGN